MLALSDFQLEQRVCEARVPQSYLFWDYSGRFWTEIVRVIPDLRLQNANPGNTQFASNDFLLVAEPGLLRATAKGHTRQPDFQAKASEFFEIAVKMFKIDVFERLGYRVIHGREYPSMPEAISAFGGFELLSVPKSSPFGTAEQTAAMDTRMTWEDDDVGVTLAVRTELRTFQAVLPWEVRDYITASSSKKNMLVVDVDRFTKKKLNRDQASAHEWIGASDRFIRKSLTRGFF
jgi:hypothetical protein